MDLKHLHYFIIAAEEGHITKAAERIGIQQPPLTQRIKAIERELDVQLFRRRARGVELTEAGRYFFENSRGILAQFAHAVEGARSTARGKQGQIRVGFAPTCPFQPFVPRVIRAFREAFPLISLQLEECLGTELIEKLRNRRLDAGLLRTPLADPQGLRVDALLEEAMLVALPSDHALSRSRDPISLGDLVDEPFILYGAQGTWFYEMILRACSAAGFIPHVCQVAPRMTSSINLVAVGLGISLVPASLRRIPIEGVVYRPLKGRVQPRAVLNLISNRGDPSAVVAHFLNLAAQTAKKFRSEHPECDIRRARK
jgi:DNA-binding transcriptional LysR family regulator